MNVQNIPWTREEPESSFRAFVDFYVEAQDPKETSRGRGASRMYLRDKLIANEVFSRVCPEAEAMDASDPLAMDQYDRLHYNYFSNLNL